jgi:hypothetical protein
MDSIWCLSIAIYLFTFNCNSEPHLGYIFAEPVDLSVVPHYTDKVSVPMDYGTISNKIDTGAYAALLEPLMKRPMDAIILRVIHDIELVHKNCSSFNPKGRWGNQVYNFSSSIIKMLTTMHHQLRLQSRDQPIKEMVCVLPQIYIDATPPNRCKGL